jgi:hydroxymethylpyrimidine/phosphomethylpyrimidine kinase
VATVITVQSTAGLRSARPVDARTLLRQVREIIRHENVRSIKIGALGSSSNARALARYLPTIAGNAPVVLDPVMRPTRGAGRLLDRGGHRSILRMLENVTVVTPNVLEAEALLGVRIRSLEDAERAGHELVGLGARAALVKGGHLPKRAAGNGVVDVLVIGRKVVRLRGPRVRHSAHGTGCMLSSLIAGRLARAATVDDAAIEEAVGWATRELRRALARPLRIGDGLLVLSP